MQVILLEKIQKLGDLGDLANVKAGYARNFLLPKGKAKPATKANLAEFESIKAELMTKQTKTLEEAQKRQAAMTDLVCNISANASDQGKLFGSVGAADIVKNLAEAGHKIEKREINMPDSISNTGEYEITITLHTDITIPVKVVVEALSKTDK